MGTGHQNPGAHKQGKGRSHAAGQLSQSKEKERKQKKGLLLHLSCCQHKGQRQDGYHPGIDCNHNARFCFRLVKGLGYIHKQGNGHKFRSIKYKGRYSDS